MCVGGVQEGLLTDIFLLLFPWFSPGRDRLENYPLLSMQRVHSPSWCNSSAMPAVSFCSNAHMHTFFAAVLGWIPAASFHLMHTFTLPLQPFLGWRVGQHFLLFHVLQEYKSCVCMLCLVVGLYLAYLEAHCLATGQRVEGQFLGTVQVE